MTDPIREKLDSPRTEATTAVYVSSGPDRSYERKLEAALERLVGMLDVNALFHQVRVGGWPFLPINPVTHGKQVALENLAAALEQARVALSDP